MEAKQKAKELVDRFTKGMKNSYYSKKCALICVDELLKELSFFAVVNKKFWQEVKQEIEKL